MILIDVHCALPQSTFRSIRSFLRISAIWAKAARLLDRPSQIAGSLHFQDRPSDDCTGATASFPIAPVAGTKAASS
jgi:hypothetical protein